MQGETQLQSSPTDCSPFASASNMSSVMARKASFRLCCRPGKPDSPSYGERCIVIVALRLTVRFARLECRNHPELYARL